MFSVIFFFKKTPTALKLAIGVFCKKIADLKPNCQNSPLRRFFYIFFTKKLLLHSINSYYSFKFIFSYNTQILFNLHLSNLSKNKYQAKISIRLKNQDLVCRIRRKKKKASCRIRRKKKKQALISASTFLHFCKEEANFSSNFSFNKQKSQLSIFLFCLWD